MAAHEEAHPEGAPEWMVSFADMVTILMAFFVVMYSMSGKKDEKTVRPVISSLKQQFGPDWPFANIVPGNYRARNIHLDKFKLFGKPAEQIGRGGTGNRPGRAGRLSSATRSLRPGEVLVTGGTVYFDSPTAELTDQQKQQLHKAAAELAGKLQKVEIRGHTSRRPLPGGSPFRDHWDLAYARCRSTMEYLVGLGIDSKRIRMTVAGGNEPDETVRTEALPRRDSRVEVFLLNEFLTGKAG